MAKRKLIGGPKRPAAPSSPRALRESLGLSQRELASLVGAHEMTVSKWERGVARPSSHQADVLAMLALAAKRGAPPPPDVRGGGSMRLLAYLLGQAFDQPDFDLTALSATNRLPGEVVRVDRGEVMSKVVIEVAPGVRVGSVITTDSVDRLRLRKGSRAFAVIKATEVMVAAVGATR